MDLRRSRMSGAASACFLVDQGNDAARHCRRYEPALPARRGEGGKSRLGDRRQACPRGALTASARNCPASISGRAVGSGITAISISPAISAALLCASPR